jgi:ABC-type transport system substrate-binding protein
MSYTQAAGEQQYGGTMKIIAQRGPTNIGYSPAMNFSDHTPGVMYAERLMNVDVKGNLKPSLAESWEYSSDRKAITFKLRKGVKFHDNTEFDAEAVRWNIQGCMDAGAVPGAKYIKSIDVIDDHTIRFNLTEPHNQIIYGIWRPFIFSPTAFKKNGEDWAITNCVSTAPFRVTEFKRDVIIKMEKFEGYWDPSRPYLDKVEFRIVKEPATCLAMMQSKQADFWFQASSQESADLRDRGLKTITGPSFIHNIYPDSKNPDSIFADKRVREALEYAIDRKAMSSALGYGFTTPLNQLAPPGSAGFNPDYQGRPYNPEKARKLLAEAGYSQGFKTSMGLRATELEKATVIRNYLAEVGIDVKLDVCDPGRYWGMIFKNGWKGLLLGVSAINPEYSVAWLHHFGPEPLVKFVSLYKTPEFLEACTKVVLAKDIQTMRELTKQMITQASEDAMAIPLLSEVTIAVTQDYVETSYLKVLTFSSWNLGDDWMKKK